MHWTELYVLDAAGEGPTGKLFMPLTAKLARYYAGPLAEYRRGGGAQGVFIATESEAASYDPANDDDMHLDEFGPDPDSVDWTGFPDSDE